GKHRIELPIKQCSRTIPACFNQRFNTAPVRPTTGTPRLRNGPGISGNAALRRKASSCASRTVPSTWRVPKCAGGGITEKFTSSAAGVSSIIAIRAVLGSPTSSAKPRPVSHKEHELQELGLCKIGREALISLTTLPAWDYPIKCATTPARTV